MEPTLYDDSGFQTMNGNFKPMKRPATLEFGSQESKRKKPLIASALLTADDVNKLKLITPEVERFIKESFPGNLKTPTPTLLRFSGHNVTEEQEEFAKGFMDALAVYHQIGEPSTFDVNVSNASRMEDMTFSSSALPCTVASTRNYTGLLPASQSSTASTAIVSATVKPSTSTFLPGARPPSVESSSSNSYPGTLTICALPKSVLVKEELQTVPSDSSSMGMSPPMSPINLEEQERIKIERKRYRNRIAASKCRQKKLARITQLENKVKDLKDENSSLGNVIAQLRNEICRLKEEVLNHTKRGCKIMLVRDY